MTKSQYEARLNKIKKRNEQYEYKSSLMRERMKYFPKFKLPSTSKLVLLGAVLLCAHIIDFCEDLILATGDTSALYALIGIPATLIPIILGYFNKAKTENSAGGITYDMAMAQFESNKTSSEDAVG